MNKADKYLIAAVLAAALILFLLQFYGRVQFPLKASGTYAQVIVQGKDIGKIVLSDDKKRSVYVLNGRIGVAKLEVQGKRIRMLEAPCPNKICVKHGWIERPGDSIICIPNEIYVYLKTTELNEIDAVTR